MNASAPPSARGRAAALLAALAAGAVLATGCAANTPLSPRTAKAQRAQAVEIERLKDRILELQRRLSVTEVELDRLRREVARLQGDPITGERQGPPSARRDSGPARPLPEEPVAPPGRPTRSDPGFEIEDIEEPPRERRASTGSPSAPAASDRDPEPPTRPPRAVEEPSPEPRSEASGSAEPPRETASASDGNAEGGSPPLTDAAQELYDRGYTLYHQGRYVDAESAFRRFLQSHAGTELADNAQYWIGEARFARGDLQAALAAFRETASRFPEGNKVPDALLKAGETQGALGDAEGARETYQEVLRRFPGTTAAAVAEDRLADLQ